MIYIYNILILRILLDFFLKFSCCAWHLLLNNPRIRISIVTSLVSQLRNPSRNTRIPRMSIAHSRMSRSSAKARKRHLALTNPPDSFRVSFMISCAPVLFLMSHQRNASEFMAASSSPSVAIMRTSCAANKTSVTSLVLVHRLPA